MSPPEIGRVVLRRWMNALPEILGVTVAAVVAWTISGELLGHSHPVFATVIAIVCLAPGVPNHRLQAGAIVLGVAIGIGTGEITLLLPGDPLIRMVLGLFVSMVLASSFGLSAVVPIQAGVSALLVLVLGSDTAGYTRLVDVLIGATVGLVLNRLLPDRKAVVDKG